MPIDNEISAELGVDAATVERVRRAIARAHGRKGGAVKSARKTLAVRRNGKLGGRKRKVLLSAEDLEKL